MRSRNSTPAGEFAMKSRGTERVRVAVCASDLLQMISSSSVVDTCKVPCAIVSWMTPIARVKFPLSDASSLNTQFAAENCRTEFLPPAPPIRPSSIANWCNFADLWWSTARGGPTSDPLEETTKRPVVGFWHFVTVGDWCVTGPARERRDDWRPRRSHAESCTVCISLVHTAPRAKKIPYITRAIVL